MWPLEVLQPAIPPRPPPTDRDTKMNTSFLPQYCLLPRSFFLPPATSRRLRSSDHLLGPPLFIPVTSEEQIVFRLQPYIMPNKDVAFSADLSEWALHTAIAAVMAHPACLPACTPLNGLDHVALCLCATVKCTY